MLAKIDGGEPAAANELLPLVYDELRKLAATKMAKEFFAAGSGGPDPYTGRDMLTTHKGMNVSEQEFIAVVDDILWALDKHGITDDTKKDVLAILYSLKGEVIRV